MKQITIICIILLTAFIIPTFSQMKYTSSGKFGIGTSSPVSVLSIGSDGYSDCAVSVYNTTSSIDRGIRVYHTPTTENYNYGIMSLIGHNSNSWKICGIYSQAHRSSNVNDIYTYGVKAYAGRGEDGLNYGVMGKLVGDRDGAGIFGCDSYYSELEINGDYAGYFLGDVYISGDLSANDIEDRSDIRTKKDVRSIGNNNVSKLSQLNGIVYKLKHPTELTETYNPASDTTKYLPIDYPKYTKDRIGLIAQEVQEVYPELVGEDNEGYLTLNYIDLIPVLVEAIKEQQLEINSLKDMISTKTGLSQSSENLVLSSEMEEFTSILFQNAPNPFEENTIIKYVVPRVKSYAMINVYDLQRSQIKSYNITQTGNGEIIIPGTELEPGLFIYNLIVDGKEVASNRMILTE